MAKMHSLLIDRALDDSFYLSEMNYFSKDPNNVGTFHFLSHQKNLRPPRVVSNKSHPMIEFIEKLPTDLLQTLTGTSPSEDYDLPVKFVLAGTKISLDSGEMQYEGSEDHETFGRIGSDMASSGGNSNAGGGTLGLLCNLTTSL